MLKYYILVILIAGCASHYDREKNDPSYQQGHWINPQVTIKDPNQRHQWHGDSATGVVAGIGATIGVAVNPEFYKRSSIGGKCIYEQAENTNIEIPCANVTVVLYDAKGREIRESNIDRGMFEFRTERGRTYTIAIKSDKYQAQKPMIGPLKMGDEIVLKLKPKNDE